MAQRTKEEELQRLKRQINEWNENRLDLFELSLPNESSEFHGVMRFFFQDEGQGAKVATKCIRVSSTASTADVLETLIEKFRPDMRMLSMPRYALYEVHVNGEERKLQLEEERPLYVQLNWGKDDREGRFLLKNEDTKTVPLHSPSGVYSENDPSSNALPPEGSGFKRKLSKREKKEKKKHDKEAKLHGKENETPRANGVAQKLYSELPETSFTRSISNPEAVMKRRRQMKLEKKLQQFKSRDGGPDTGGTLKIYGDSVKPDVPYKTLLLSTGDTVAHVVRETLEKYGLEKDDAGSYCLVQVIVPPSGHEYHGSNSRSEEFILNDDDCPLAILMQHLPSQGTIMFQLRRRTEMPKKKKKRSSGSNRPEQGLAPEQRPPGPDRLPFLIELNPDGSESYQRGKVLLPLNVTEVGSEQSMNGHYLQLYGPDIVPKHCVLAHMEGIVTATPASQDADTYVNNQRIYETTVLQHGALLHFGKRHMFRFYDPVVLEAGSQRPVSGDPGSKRVGPTPDARKGQPAIDPSNFETTFDVDGHIETVTRDEQSPLMPGAEDLLPATLEFREEGEDAFLAAVISEVNGVAVQFKLAPTYTLYMAIRYRILRVSHPNLRMAERAHWIASLVSKIANMVHLTILESEDRPGALSFWMANASELLHFVKHDRQLQGAPHMMEAQDSLAEAVQLAFSHLVDCLQEELANAMPAFLEESLRDLDADDAEQPVNVYPADKPTLGDVLQVLSSAMSLLRRCRVNAALTIQLFSQLFHFINMWLFNTLMLEPGLCTRHWGHRWKRRLGRIEMWAEKQGLELAADCHLARIIQAAHLLEAPKSSGDDIASISSACFKLNSMQLRVLLEHYVPGPSEPHIPQELIESVVGVAESTADELTRSDGRQVQLKEEPHLQLPFLLPEDGYSCDIVRGVPSGLADFLDPLCKTGICRFVVRAGVSGLWTVYFVDQGSQENISGNIRDDISPPRQQPEVISVTFGKVNGSMGLSIVAAKGEGQKERGIYVKSVVNGGGAAKDGRLQAGDQLLEVDGYSLTGLTQEKAAEYMTRTGHSVTLKVAKQGAIYHGLAPLLSQPSPIMQRAAPSQKVRPHSDEMSRYPGRPEDYPRHPQQVNDARQRAINQQMAAGSSPSLTGSQGSDRVHPADPTDRRHQGPTTYGQQDPSQQMALRSKSTSNLDAPPPQDYRQQTSSVSTLPRNHQQQHPTPAPAEHSDLSQGEFNAPKANQKNYPQGRYDEGGQRSPQIPPQPTYVNQSEIRQQYAGNTKHGASPPRQGNLEGPPRQGNLEGPPRQGNLEGPPRQGNLEGRTAKSLSNLNHEEVHQRPVQRQRPHELEQQGLMGAPPYYKNAPREYEDQPRPMKAVPLQKPSEDPRNATHNGYYEARPVRAQDAQRPSYQQRVADVSRPPHGYSPPRVATSSSQQPRYPNGDSRYPNGDVRGRPEFQRDKQSPLTRMDKYGHTNQSPDLPPPPDMPPDLPPPPEGLPPYSDELPPPPPHLSGDPGAPDQWRRGPENPDFHQQRNAPDVMYDQHGKPMQKPGPYPVANYGTYQNQPAGASRPQQPPMKPPHDTRQLTKPKPSSGQYQPRRESEARSQSTDAQPANQKPKPPVAVKPVILVSDLTDPGVSPSPWEREQKEQEIKRLEEEARRLRQHEIQELEALGDRLSSQGRERLRRLRLDEEFDRRVREASSRDEDDAGVDSDTEMGERASGRAKMLRMMQDDLERKQKQSQEDKCHQSVEDTQVNEDMMERQERRLQRFETECDEQRVRQMKRQEKRAQATEDYLIKQREMRERQRREMEEHQRQQRVEDEKQRERQREELRRKKELELSKLREVEERVMREAAQAAAQAREVAQAAAQAREAAQAAAQTREAAQAAAQTREAAQAAAQAREAAQARDAAAQVREAAESGPQYRGHGAGPKYGGPGPQYTGPTNPQYTGQTSAPGPQYTGYMNDSGPQYAGQTIAPGPQYAGQANAPGPQYAGQANAPGPQYAGQANAPGPPYVGQANAPGPQYVGQANAPGHQYTGQVNAPGPQYEGQMSAPGPQYPGQAGSPGPQYTGQVNAPGSQYGGQPSGPGPQYKGPGHQYTSQVTVPGQKLNTQPADSKQRPSSAIYSRAPERHVPTPPERWSSYDLYKETSDSTSYSGLPHEPVPAGIQQVAPPPRSQSSSSSVLRQPDQMGTAGKKSVSFNSTLATEIHDYSRFDSTSSSVEAASYPTSPEGYANSFDNRVPAAQYSQAPPTPEQSIPEPVDQRTPENTYDPRLILGSTPGVVGAQEVYRDPRDRIAASKALPTKPPGPERMSFRDKMKMFAHEAGEGTPKEKTKISRAQQWIEVTGQ